MSAAAGPAHPSHDPRPPHDPPPLGDPQRSESDLTPTGRVILGMLRLGRIADAIRILGPLFVRDRNWATLDINQLVRVAPEISDDAVLGMNSNPIAIPVITR